METFDLIVIGAGSGLTVSAAAAEMGLKVAVVEEGPLGGTCLNRGCIPSKMLIHSADVMELLKRAPLFGIHPRAGRTGFRRMVERVNGIIDADAASIERGIRSDPNSTLFRGRARFVGERTLQVGKNIIRGEKVIIAAGTRPRIPKVEGLERVPFLTSKEALRLRKQPRKLTIIGGGYIGAELGHFFGALGTEVSIIQNAPLLIPNEDRHIAAAFTRIAQKRFRLFLGHRVLLVRKKGNAILTSIAPSAGRGRQRTIVSDQLLVAVGLVPNTDVLAVQEAGIAVNERGFVKTNEYLETSAKNVWALGDIAGRFLFKHSANLEAQYVVQNALHRRKAAADYTAMPHAIFTSPQIAGVGETQQQLDARKAAYAVGTYRFINTGMGAALADEEGFVRVYANRKTRKILGCHIIGTDASTLIHEVVVAMRAGLTVDDVARTVHVHPALSEVVQRACAGVEW